MINKTKSKRILFLVSFFLILFTAFNVGAVSIGDYTDFNVDERFEKDAKLKVSATLIKTSPNLYFYVEKNWWEAQVLVRQNEILINLNALAAEFDDTIYPTLTSVYGFEWKPGVDGDNKITVLLHPMKEGFSGYFRTADEYIKLQTPSSNEREMLYLSTSYIDNTLKMKIFLAHEFTHLITFNQKDRLLGVAEEVWLNEARAEYSATILGYNSIYGGSNLQTRVKDFLEKPSDSLTEWQESKYDYGSISLFINYLVDHYGINMLSDSLQSKSVGIASINEILLKNGYKDDFSQIFTYWTMALIINDCSSDIKYCYLNKNLSGFKINPTLVFLPFSSNSSLTTTNVTKNWSGNWQKIIGGNGDLKLEFSSISGLNFKVPYLLFDKNNKYSIEFMALDKSQKGEVTIKDFSGKYHSLIIIPSLQTKISGFNGLELTYPYTFKVSIGEALEGGDSLIQKLLAEIESLKNQIERLKSGNQKPSNNLCAKISSNLYFGAPNKNEVMCLQAFLKSQGANIYPEGLITGNFGNLTKAAVVRFQEKYKNEILTPIGLSSGTGFVGTLTRAKINSILNRPVP